MQYNKGVMCPILKAENGLHCRIFVSLCKGVKRAVYWKKRYLYAIKKCGCDT